METVDIIIGIVVFFLLLSLVASAIAEMISTKQRWRGKNLRKAVQAFLNGSPALVEALYAHPRIAVHSPQPEKPTTALPMAWINQGAAWLMARMRTLLRMSPPPTGAMPSYLPQQDVARATLDLVIGMPAEECGCLLDVFVEERRQFGAHSGAAADVRLANDLDAAYKVVRPFVVDANGDLTATVSAIGKAFDTVTQRSVGWFKRRMSVLLLCIGFVLAVFSNGDALHVAGRLTADPTLRKLAVELAPSLLAIQYPYVDSTGQAAVEPDSAIVDSAAVVDSVGATDTTVHHGVAHVQDTRTPLDSIMIIAESAGALSGGWSNDPLLVGAPYRTWYGWIWAAFLKLIGLSITAAAVSLGAPFWFDVLSKIVNVRSALKPTSKADKEEGQAQESAPSLSESARLLTAHTAIVQGGIDTFDIERTSLLVDIAMAAYSSESEAVAQMKHLGHEVLDARLIDVTATDTQALVVRSGNRIIVSYRGTEKKLADFYTDATIAQIPIINRPTAMVHKGFATALDSAWTDVRGYVDNLLEGKAEYTVHFCGHSLGGALAVLGATRYAQNHGTALLGSVVTIGQPRVGNDVFAAMASELLGERYTRAVNNRDVVPRVPVSVAHSKYHHFGRLHYFDSNGILWVNPSWVARLVDYVVSSDELITLLKDKVSDHSASTYALLYRNLRSK